MVRLIGYSYSVIVFSFSDTPMKKTSFAVKLIVSVVPNVKVQVVCHDRLMFGLCGRWPIDVATASLKSLPAIDAKIIPATTLMFCPCVLSTHMGHSS